MPLVKIGIFHALDFRMDQADLPPGWWLRKVSSLPDERSLVPEIHPLSSSLRCHAFKRRIIFQEEDGWQMVLGEALNHEKKNFL